jgi:hypothetical protein
MCVEIYNKTTKQTAESVQQFAEMLGVGVEEIPASEHYKDVVPEGCLCQIDVEKTCELFGFSYHGDSDFNIEITKK